MKKQKRHLVIYEDTDLDSIDYTNGGPQRNISHSPQRRVLKSNRGSNTKLKSSSSSKKPSIDANKTKDEEITYGERSTLLLDLPAINAAAL